MPHRNLGTTKVQSGRTVSDTEELANEVSEIILERLAAHASTTVDFHQNPEFQNWLDERINFKVQKWFVGLILAYCIPAAAAVFVLGGISEKLDNALTEQKLDKAALQARGVWIRDQERWNCQASAEIERMGGRPVIPCNFASSNNPSDQRR